MEENLPSYQILKDSPKVLPMIYQDCAQPAVKKLGRALETVFELGNTILLPLKLINERSRLNFKKHMDRYKNSLENVKDEKVIDVPTLIGTPIIDRLTYVTNDEIADLFINLLTKSSSSDTVNEAHPAFIHIIDRMTVDEAKLIKHISGLEFIPFINLISKKNTDRSVFQKFAWDLTGLEFDVELSCPSNIDIYMNNLRSLKIIEPQGATFKTIDSVYERLQEKYADVIRKGNETYVASGEYRQCEVQKGFYEITDLGHAFINACTK